MFGYLILLFTILPALELAVLIHIGGYIGTANTIMVIILTGIAGAYLARIQGFLVIQSIQKSMEQGRMPTDEMIEGLMIFGGGIMLLTPGFITDTMGFLLLIPWTRTLIKNIVRKKFQTTIYPQQSTASKTDTTRRLHDDAADAEFRE